jgi:hypothetical protein
MRRARSIVVVIMFLNIAGAAGAEPSPAERALDRLRGLSGAWKGSFEWSGGRTGTGEVKAAYQVTGNSSAVIENLVMGKESVPSMTSVYHLDGSELRMTHYCAAQNQPRLRATRIADDVAEVEFSFVDGTNMVAHPAHVEALGIRFVTTDRLVLQFTFDAGGKKSVERIELKRVERSAGESEERGKGR